MSALIFGIGLPKTGTSSLAKAVKILGHNALHDYKLVERTVHKNISDQKRMLRGLHDEYTAFFDYPIDISFNTLDIQYPGSKFILTERDFDSWIRSRQAHAHRYNNSFDYDSDKAFYTRHYKFVPFYFSDRPDDLLRFNIWEGDGWDKLCKFLNAPVPVDIDFPWENKTE